jgi:hypothetical protein
LPREPSNYWRRPEIYVLYWLFFAVGFTEEGMAALHDLISTGNRDFSDPVFWFSYLISPVNTITAEIQKMLPKVVTITFRSPTNRKAYQLWRYKIAMSYIKIIVAFGDPVNLDKEHMNEKTQPFLHAMVSNKKYGRLQYETEQTTKNNYVDGLTRAFLISFPEKFKDWADGTIWRYTPKQKIPLEDSLVDTSNEPCDVKIDPNNVWKAFKASGVFESNANYDVPSSWDPYKLFCLMNKGDRRMINFSTNTLQMVAAENKRDNAPDGTPKKRKKSAATANENDRGKLPDDHLCIPTDCQEPYNFFLLQ